MSEVEKNDSMSKAQSEPKVGMEFEDDEKAYDFYNKYALKVGFSVRIENVKRKPSGQIRSRMFVCNKEGFRKTFDKIVKYERAEERIGCNAYMKIKLTPTGRYVIVEFEPEHNHECVSPAKVHMLRSHRVMKPTHIIDAQLAIDAGVNQKAAFQYLANKAGSRRSLPFNRVDLKNCLCTIRQKEMEAGDGGTIMHYLQKKAKEDRRFYSAIQVDEADQITNIFWTDARSRMDYEYFGDVVCFDTTYKTNGYGRPFAPFVGVNHHKQSIIFGAALLYDETIPSFKWLFETFKEAMKGKAPQVILTDQDGAMKTAIEDVWPETHHRLCVWHMYINAAKHLSHVFQANSSFKHDFGKCVYEYEYEEDFIFSWKNMLEKYDLKENKWLSNLYEDREKWALVYGRGVFRADMMTTQRSESINSVIKRYLSTDQNLVDFFKHYERLLEDRRYDELQADFQASQSTPKVPFSWLILKQAATTYTSKVYEMFLEEFKKYNDYSLFKVSEDAMVCLYEITDEGRKRTSYVTFDVSKNHLICSYRKFEFVGILCSHALKVLDNRNIKLIPEQYILKRWRKDAKSGVIHNDLINSHDIDEKVAIVNRYDALGRIYNLIIAKGWKHKKHMKLL